jgi:hypothetical protein
VDELLRRYPDFVEVKERQELQYLLAFRNIIRIALLVIPPLSNKQLLLNIGGRLEGSGNEYITGTGQKICVTRRVIIYEQEGSVTVQKKKPKIPYAHLQGQPQGLKQTLGYPQGPGPQLYHHEPQASSGSGSSGYVSGTSAGTKHQSNHEYVSSSKIKRIRLADEDIKELLSKPTPPLNQEALRALNTSSTGALAAPAIFDRQPPAYSTSSSSFAQSSSTASMVSSSFSSVPPTVISPSLDISQLKGRSHSR